MLFMARKNPPNRKGKPLNLALTPDLVMGVDNFMNAQVVPPTKTALAQKALRDYLTRLGFLPIPKVGEPVPNPPRPTSPPPISVARPVVSDRYAELWYVGPIAAGTPLEVFDNPPERIDLGEELGGEGRYVFVVRGDSMEQERIFDGDRVVIQRDPEPKGGDIVVARIDRALTLKKLMATRGDEIRVVSCDGKSKSFVLQPDRGDAILGKFVAVYRKAK